MKMKGNFKRIATILMAVLVVIASIGINPQEVSAKTSNKITFRNGSKITLYAGEYVNINISDMYCSGQWVYNYKWKSAASFNKKTELKYKSSDNSVATVSKSGKIIAKKKGTATITVTSKYSSAVKGKIKVNVTKKAQKNAKLQLQSKKATIGVNKTKQIKVKTLTGVSSKGVKFSIEKEKDKKVASVTSKGIVKGKKAGTATITVTSKVNSKVKATFKVTVKNNDTLSTKINKTGKKKITLAKDHVELAPLSSFQYWQDLQNDNPYLKREITESLSYYQKAKQNGAVVAAQMLLLNKEKYGTAQIKIASVTGLKSAAVTYKSSDKRVATVSGTGLVTPKKAGTAVITVTSKEDKSVTAKYTVNVSKYVTAFDFMKYTNLNDSWQNHLLYVCPLPSDAANQNYTVKSSDESIIKVTKYPSGEYALAGMKEGTAKITITSKDGKCEYSWKCTVSSGETTCWGWRGMGED